MHVTLPALLGCAPSLPVQLTLLVLQAGLQFQLISWFGLKVYKPWMSKKPYVEQYKELNQKLFKTGYGIDFDLEGAYEFACLVSAIMIQHAIGGLLCMPAVLGLCGSLGAPLARHGALCEAGWELQDYLYRIYELMFKGEEGKKKNPPAMMVVMAIHHTMGLSMIVPMNIYYPDNYWYFVLVFQLQGAAAIGLGLQQFGFTLDVGSASGLKMMRVVVTITFITMLLTRFVIYIPVVYNLLCIFYAGSERFFIGGCVAAGLMGLMNLMMCVDATGKFQKFALASDITETMVQAGGKDAKRRLSYTAFGGSNALPTVDAIEETAKTAKRLSTVAVSGAGNTIRRMSGMQSKAAAAREPLLAGA